MILITVLIFQHPITEVTSKLWSLKMESLNMPLPISPTGKIFATCQASPHRTSLSVNCLHQHFFHTLPDSSFFMLIHVLSETLPILINFGADTADHPRMVSKMIGLNMSWHIMFPGQHLVTLQTLPHSGDAVIRDNLCHLGGDHHVEKCLISAWTTKIVSGILINNSTFIVERVICWLINHLLLLIIARRLKVSFIILDSHCCVFKVLIASVICLS